MLIEEEMKNSLNLLQNHIYVNFNKEKKKEERGELKQLKFEKIN